MFEHCAAAGVKATVENTVAGEHRAAVAAERDEQYKDEDVHRGTLATRRRPNGLLTLTGVLSRWCGGRGAAAV